MNDLAKPCQPFWRRVEMVNDYTIIKVERPNLGHCNSSSSIVNFSHFARPAALVTAVSLGKKMIDSKEKVLASGGSSPVESTCKEGLNSRQIDDKFHVQSAMCSMVNTRQQFDEAPKKLFHSNYAISSIKNYEPLVQNDASFLNEGDRDGERTVESMIASSSVGSDSNDDRVSCEKMHNPKRKFSETEDSECQSDDIRTEYCIARKATPSRGNESKRSKKTEVHSRSGRRRRDRFNRKMCALQELIPNCNKADEVTMLDEAIEYLKTLQHRVLNMFVGTRLFMPPLEFPLGIRQVHPAQIPLQTPIGMEMGVLEMIDGGSLVCPIFPVPLMQGTHFLPPMFRPFDFRKIPSFNLLVSGHPNQGLLCSVPRAHLVPLAMPLDNHAMGFSNIGSHIEVQRTYPILNSQFLGHISNQAVINRRN